MGMRLHVFVIPIVLIHSAGVSDVRAEGMMQVLDGYVRTGLKCNLGLRQEAAEHESAEASVNEARAKFFPTVNLSSRYTRAAGGRSVTIPVGDFMSPLFNSLGLPVNPETVSSLNATNVTIVPTRDQETKLQLMQPLFAPEIYENYRMNVLLLKSKTAGSTVSRRALIRDIRCAYFTCLQAREAIVVRSAACLRSERQLLTARKLFDAGVITRTGVLAAEAAASRSRTDSLKSVADLDDACRAFNILLNRSPAVPVAFAAADSGESMLFTEDTATAPYGDSALIESRPEMVQLGYADAALRAYERVERSAFVPKIAAALEGGIVGEQFAVNDKTRFYTASLLLQWELFSGFGRRNKVYKAKCALESMDAKIEETRAMLLLQLHQVRSDRMVAARRCSDSELQRLAAEKNYEEVTRRFEQGAATAQDVVEAQELFTGAEAAVSVARYELCRQWALLRFAAGSDGDGSGTVALGKGNE